MMSVLQLVATAVAGFLLAWYVRPWWTRRSSRVEGPQRPDQTHYMLDRFNAAIETAGFMPWEIDAHSGRFTWAENRLRGFGLDQLSLEEYGAALGAMMDPDDREAMTQIARDAIRAGDSSYSYNYRLRRPDGLVRHMHSRVRVVRDTADGSIRLLGSTTDVTNEVQTLELLQRQAEHERKLLDRLSMATQVANISSWELDLGRQEFLWLENPIAAIAPDSLESKDVSILMERIHPDDRPLAEQKMAEALANGSDRITYRYRAFGRDGRIVHIQNFGKLLFDEHSQLKGLLGVSWDVTHEIEAAEKLEDQARRLRDAERRMQRATLFSSEGHWEFESASKSVWISSSYAALLGYREGEIPSNMDAFESFILHPEDRARSFEVLNRHIEQGAPYVVDHRLRTASGEYRWIRTRGSSERNADGHLVSMSGSIHDIHEQKLAEDALRHAQERFERAIAGTEDGLWETDADGTAWSSPRLARLLGFDELEAGASMHFLRDRLHPDDAAREEEIRRAHLKDYQPYDVELRLQMRDGEYRWFRVRGRAGRDASGRALRFSGSLQDVSEARAARDELLRATEAAEAANRAKSEFLANVSHEIRTPMNGIIGMTGLLLDTALDRTQRDYADTIRGSADSLLIVINDILDFSKIEAGKLDMESIEMDLVGNVEDVGGTMAFQAAARNLDLIVHVHADVPARVNGDPQRLRQCLINLVGNAIKFTQEGEIVIEVSLAGRRDGRALVQFEVRDTGIGIAPETLKSLFQPFVQADSSTTRHFGGTGLGLSIVRRLVEMMGGDVGVDSEVGKGSTFWFVLPMEPVAQAAAAAPIDLARLGRRVLVVDDQETNRRVLAGQLMHAGYEVSLAGSGNETLRMMRQALADNHPFEVVLVDYRMQDMDGAMLGQQINADPRLSQARIVVLTSVDRHGDVRRFASLGFAGYLTKPVRSRELFDCMDRVLSRDAREWHMQSQPLVTRSMLNGSGEQARRYQGRVLLVEDNAVNQKVAVRFLERLGCSVRVADNGAEGVKAWQEGRYDLVLMDLQMPVMDGLTATRQIRDLERGRPDPATQIVALTANAMAGQLEICLRAGMNDFLTKPLQIARLHETLDRLGLAAPADATATQSAGTGASGTPVDLTRVRELTEGDDDFAEELASTFITSGEQVLQEIVAALDDLDRMALSRAAHKLKGASANICAEPLRQLASDLEANGAGLDQQRLRELVFNVAQEFRRTAQFLEEEMIRDRKAG